MPNTLRRLRVSAFLSQHGGCLYCHKNMWLSAPAEFAVELYITVNQALHFQCTAEHLSARKNGGGNTAAMSPLPVCSETSWTCNAIAFNEWGIGHHSF